LLALNTKTGDLVWETEREVETTWSSPILAETENGWQIVINANPYIAAYEPARGEELWRYEGILGEVASSPAFAEGTIVAVNQIMNIFALDAATGALVWETYDDLPEVASPLITEGVVIIATGFGVVTGLDVATGEVVWRHEFDEGFYASPVLAGSNIYLFDRAGTARILDTGSQFQVVHNPVVGEAVLSTPAFYKNRIYIRGEKHLICIGAPDG
jgi:outer membrane protein assembly factor BamB